MDFGFGMAGIITSVVFGQIIDALRFSCDPIEGLTAPMACQKQRL